MACRVELAFDRDMVMSH